MEGLILNMLEFEDVGRGVGEPDGGNVCEDRADEGLVGGYYGLLYMVLGGASKGF